AAGGGPRRRVVRGGADRVPGGWRQGGAARAEHPTHVHRGGGRARRAVGARRPLDLTRPRGASEWWILPRNGVGTAPTMVMCWGGAVVSGDDLDFSVPERYDNRALLVEAADRVDALLGHLGAGDQPVSPQYGDLIRGLLSDVAEFGAYPDVYPVSVADLP